MGDAGAEALAGALSTVRSSAGGVVGTSGGGCCLKELDLGYNARITTRGLHVSEESTLSFLSVIMKVWIPHSSLYVPHSMLHTLSSA